VRRSRHVLALPLVLVAALGAGCSSGSSSASATVATGGVTCSDITGTVNFSPPLTATGTSAERTSIQLAATGCTTSHSNVGTVQSGALSSTLSTPSNACASLLTSKPVSVDVAWTPKTVHPSAVKISGYTVGVSPSGGGGFKLPEAGGTVHVSGSFAGSDNGASSTASIYSAQSAMQLIGECESPSGLASIPVASGTIKLQ
jgi:hypothetical protein